MPAVELIRKIPRTDAAMKQYKMIVLIAGFFYLYPELVVGSDEQGDFANLGGRMKFSLGREGSFALGILNNDELIGGFKIPMSCLHRVSSH